LYKSYQASKKSPRCEPIPLEPDPRDELCEAAVAMKPIEQQDYDSKYPGGIPVTLVNISTKQWERLMRAVEAYKKGK
jgi:hypothetical protein